VFLISRLTGEVMVTFFEKIVILSSMITKEDIKHLAKLARIEISPEREDQLVKDVSRILAYVEDLKQVNTDGLPEIAQVTGLKNALREDIETSSSQADAQALINSAPAQENGYVKVKAIFE
jgi:aspartyl-tRNA(Asn)/glutamyl-tRNA(Gln) amidotransferase subunit C